MIMNIKKIWVLLLFWSTLAALAQDVAMGSNLLESKGLMSFRPMDVVADQPEALMKVWVDEPIPLSFYSEADKAAQKIINTKVSDGIITYSPISGEKEWIAIDYEEITPHTWKWVDFELAKGDGSLSKVHLLRPHWWLKSQGADRVGNKVYLDMPEMGITGWAELKSIRINQLDTRFWEENRQGDFVTRPVTGKFEHETENVYELTFEGGAGPLGVTGTHPIYSMDRKGWVEVQSLKEGELVKTKTGTLPLLSSKKLEGKHKVYNLEVYRDHNYLVSTDRVLVHNGCLPKVRWIKHNIWNKLTKLGLEKKFKDAMDKGLAPRRMGQGSTGIIELTEQEMKQYPGYTFKIKIDGKGASHYRILGNTTTDSKGNPILIFDEIVND